MIEYEVLCTALDRYNRRLRGEVIAEDAPREGDGFDIVEEAPGGSSPPPHPAFGASYGAGVPDVTAETVLPEGGYGQPGADPNAGPPPFRR